MNHKLKFFSLILSSFFIFSCVHTQDGKFVFKKSHCHSKKSYKKGKKCCAKKAEKKCCSRKAEKKCCKHKKRGEKKKHCKSRCQSKKEKCGDACKKRDSVVGLALVKGFGNQIKGSVSFERAGYKQVQLTAQVEGLGPNKKFGFHVHEFGNCENKAVMAGAHLNPGDEQHGSPQAEEKHLGDLGNLSSDKQGKAQLSLVLNGKLNRFMGRSVIIHEAEDDLKSQPTGNSGKRIACGIIGAGPSPVQPETAKEPQPKETAQAK